MTRTRGAVRVALPRVHDAAGEQVGVGGPRSRDRAGARSDRAESRGRPKRRGTRWSRCADEQHPREREQQPRAAAARGVSRATPPAVATIGAPVRPVPAWSTSACVVPSIRWPNGTDDGHAASHPRHCTHVSMCRGTRRRAARRRTRPRAWRRCARAARAARGRSPGTSGNAAGTARTRRTRRARPRRRGGRPARDRGSRAARGASVTAGLARQPPGRHLPVGIERGAARVPTEPALGGGDTEAVEPGRARLAEQPAAGRSAAARARGQCPLVVGGDVDGADADLRQPAHAVGVAELRRRASRASAAAPRCGPGARPVGHAEPRAAFGRAPADPRRARRPRRPRPPRAARACVAPSHARHDGRYRRGAARTGSASVVNHSDVAGAAGTAA